MDLNRQNMPAPKFAHTPRGKNHINSFGGNNSSSDILSAEDNSAVLKLANTDEASLGDIKKPNNQQQTSKSVELAELSQFQSVLKRHDPSAQGSSKIFPAPGSTGGVHRITNNQNPGGSATELTTQSLPDSLSELKIRHHESTKLVPSSGGHHTGLLGGVNGTLSGFGFQQGGGGANGFRSDTPISGVNNMASVRLPSLQKQPASGANKYSRYSGASLPNGALRN